MLYSVVCFMTRSISLALFFVMILAGVFWFTGTKVDNQSNVSPLRMSGPRVKVVSAEPDSSLSKFQFAISTVSGSLHQMNRESSAVAARVQASVVLVRITYKTVPTGKTSRKSAEETVTRLSSGFVVGTGNEVLCVIPPEITPLNIQVRLQNGSEIKADFIGRDGATEIALLRLSSPAPNSPIKWRNRRHLEWGEQLYAMARNGTHGAQMLRVMVSGDAILKLVESASTFQHYRQLDQMLPPDFSGAVLVDGDGQGAGLVLQPDAPDQVRALVLDGGEVRVVTEALRSLQKHE